MNLIYILLKLHFIWRINIWYITLITYKLIIHEISIDDNVILIYDELQIYLLLYCLQLYILWQNLKMQSSIDISMWYLNFNFYISRGLHFHNLS